MSHAADTHAAEDHGHGADGHDHVDAAEGPDELPPDEPKTPLWLTALGGGLFLAVAIGWLGTRSSGSTLSELSPAPSASASAVPTAVEAPPHPAPLPPPPPAPAVSAAPSAKPVLPAGKPRLRIKAP